MTEHPSPNTAELGGTAPRKPKTADAARWVAATALLAALTATGALAARHFYGVTIPGCSDEGGCAAAEASAVGTIAGLPLSCWGLAYFAALAIAWITPGFEKPGALLYLVRAG